MASLLSQLVIDDNEDGWGPSTIPEKFKDVPYYAPFNKGDKIGRAADWQQQNQGKFRNQKGGDQQGVATIFNWHYQDDDSTFQLVDNQRGGQLKRSSVGVRRFQKSFQQRGQQRGHNLQQTQTYQKKQQQNTGYQQQNQRKQQNSGQKNQFVQRKWGAYDNNQQRKRDPSVEVKPDWSQVEEITFAVLNKANIDEEPRGEDIKICGSVEYWDKSYDRVVSKVEKPLERTDKSFFNVTTGDDPIIRQLSTEEKGTVFATDVILSHLMASTRSIYPWDIIVTKVGSKLFFDKRDGSQFDYLTVNETALEPPIDDGRDATTSPASLAREATFINQAFSQQILAKEEAGINYEEPNPFSSEGQVPASVAYRYRKFNVSENIVLVARCEVNALNKGRNNSFAIVRSLNEFDLKSTDWRKKIDSQRGAVFATELKNNAFKLAKWGSEAVISGADNVKLGFVSRVTQRDNYNHVILATQDYGTREFISTINMNMKNSWGTLKKIVDVCMKQDSGKFVLMRDSDKNIIRLYSVPEDTFKTATKE